jgi:anti-sigma regulatory factor (Ser/Thr protein kinase)
MWCGWSIADARRFVRDVLEHWHFDPVAAEKIVLVTSELVTNALVHTAGPVRIGIDRRNDAVVICVEDPTPSPMPHDVEVNDEPGRGLTTVRNLPQAFGWSGYPHHKVVWAVLAPSP